MNIRKKATLAAGVGALGILACLIGGPHSGGSGISTRSGRLQWGLMTMRHHGFSDDLTERFKQYHRRPDYIMFFYPLGRPFPTRWMAAADEAGTCPIVSLELYEWAFDRMDESYLPAICSGKYDDSLRQWAVDAKTYGKRILLRFGYEFNGDWFPWSLDPAGFKRAWRRAHDIFRAAGADNVEWLWSPNIESCPDKPENDMHLYYPGDAYVDWVGVDGYNFGDHHDRWHKWQSFEEVFADVLDDLDRRYPNKPIFIPEFGCAAGEPEQRVRWIRDAFAYIQDRPRIQAVVWFDLDKRREHEPDFRINTTPESLEAFNETFASDGEPGLRR